MFSTAVIIGEIKESVALALSLSVSTAVILGGLTRWGGNGVEILHDALQVLHLVVQLLRAVAVAGLKDHVISSQPPQLWLRDILPECRE